MVKLFIVALVLIVGGAILGITTDLDPAPLFLGGAVCAFLGLVNLVSPTYEPGPAVSAGDASEAHSLANLQNYGSAVGNANGVFHNEP